jgi:hypothetical protein
MLWHQQFLVAEAATVGATGAGVGAGSNWSVIIILTCPNEPKMSCRYFLVAPRAPDLHELQTPKPLPLPRMEAQRPVMLAYSSGLRVDGTKLCSTAL